MSSKKSGVTTKSDGTQFLEEDLTASEKASKSEELAKLIMDRDKLIAKMEKKTADYKDDRKILVGNLALLEGRMSMLGYEVHNKVKRVARQKDLPFQDEGDEDAE